MNPLVMVHRVVSVFGARVAYNAGSGGELEVELVMMVVVVE